MTRGLEGRENQPKSKRVGGKGGNEKLIVAGGGKKKNVTNGTDFFRERKRKIPQFPNTKTKSEWKFWRFGKKELKRKDATKKKKGALYLPPSGKSFC